MGTRENGFCWFRSPDILCKHRQNFIISSFHQYFQVFQSQRHLQNNVNNFDTRFCRFVTRTSVTLVLGLTVINSRNSFLTGKRAYKKRLEGRLRVWVSQTWRSSLIEGKLCWPIKALGYSLNIFTSLFIDWVNPVRVPVTPKKPKRNR